MKKRHTNSDIDSEKNYHKLTVARPETEADWDRWHERNELAIASIRRHARTDGEAQQILETLGLTPDQLADAEGKMRGWGWMP